MTDSAESPLSVVLFSGTEDRLMAAAVLTAGAAALGRPVNIFLQYWALDAFRADRIALPKPLAPEAGEQGRQAVDRMNATGQQSWSDTLRLAKEIGEVDVKACSLSMDLLQLSPDQLDPLVDGVAGVAAFFVNAGEGQVVFI